MATNLIRVEDSMLIGSWEHSSVTWTSRVLEVASRLFVLLRISSYAWRISGKKPIEVINMDIHYLYYAT